MEITVKNLEQVVSNLDTSVRKVNTGVNSVLKDASDIYVNVLRGNTPVLSGEARASVRATNVITDAAMYKKVKMGYGADVAWRMWFLEDGTYSKGNPKGISPRRMVKKSLDSTQDSMMNAMRDGIGALIGTLGGG